MVKGHIGSAIHTVFTGFLCLTLVLFSIIQIRHGAAVVGLLPLRQANAYEYKNEQAWQGVSGRTTVEVQYCSEEVSASDPSNRSGRTSTSLTFDDAWFKEEAGVYNHGLATACSTLSAICNSESQFYGSVEGAAPYAEQALGALGFKDIRSDSYALRSDLLDQFASLFVGPLDVSAYVLASKTLVDNGEAPDETLIFVGIRGSYGIEWLSNLRLFFGGAESFDHPGFSSAEQKVLYALEAYTEEIGADPAHSKILVTGHSRGGALANLLAADLISGDKPSRFLAPADHIYAYTFATPGTSRDGACDSSAYASIFNILNPCDLATQFPLSVWGYGRYGTTVLLPGSTDGDFEARYAAMQNDYKSNTGYVSPYTSQDFGRLDGIDGRAARVAPTMESVWRFETLCSMAEAMLDIDMMMAVSAHYPDTYIAWMQSIEPGRIMLD